MNYFYQHKVNQFYLALVLFLFALIINAPLITIIKTFMNESARHDFILELYLSPQVIDKLFISLKVSALCGMFSFLFCALSGYALAVFEFKLKKLVLLIMLIILCVPFSFQLIPTIINSIKLGFLNQHIGIWLPFVVPVLGVFIVKQFIESTINPDLIEAGRMEGANEFHLFYKLIMPLIKPALVIVFLIQFSFVWYLNEYPLILIQIESIQPISIFPFGEFSNVFDPRGMTALTVIFTGFPIILLLMCSGYIYKFLKSDFN